MDHSAFQCVLVQHGVSEKRCSGLQALATDYVRPHMNTPFQKSGQQPMWQKAFAEVAKSTGCRPWTSCAQYVCAGEKKAGSAL